jgi:hypothetical protein
MASFVPYGKMHRASPAHSGRKNRPGRDRWLREEHTLHRQKGQVAAEERRTCIDGSAAVCLRAAVWAERDASAYSLACQAVPEK